MHLKRRLTKRHPRRKKSEELSNDKKDVLYHIVTKLLYVSKRAILGISPTIAFLCTRASKSPNEDWEKVRRLLQYLKGTLDIKMIIEIDGLIRLRTCVDVSCTIHMDMKRHTGGLISLGRGVIHTKSSKKISVPRAQLDQNWLGLATLSLGRYG